MSGEITLTPNLKLSLANADRRNWTSLMNNNLTMLDAAVGAYFIIQNLKGVWANSTQYEIGDTVIDVMSATVWKCQVAHLTPGPPTTFAEERADNPAFWSTYTAAASARGAWLPNTSYSLNDFVVSGAQYAICIESHISSGSFSADVAAARWSILVDLSQAGSQVLPIPGGVGDANKAVATPNSGNGYTLLDGDTFADAVLQASSIGLEVLRGTSQAAIRAILDAAQASALGTAAFANIADLGVPTTGDLKPTHKTVADSGWIMWSDGTIGNGSSGATIRSNEDCRALYTLYWGYGDARCPVSGGRGANANADFDAGKAISIPKGAGRAIGVAGSGSGLTARNSGDVVGEETHALTANENGAHNHGVNDPSHVHGLNDPWHSHSAVDQVYAGLNLQGGGFSVNSAGGNTGASPTGITMNAAVTGISIQTSGSGTAHNNMQPTAFCNWMIKL